MKKIRTVTIPGSDNHDGWHSIRVTLKWICPVCGEPRGKPHRALSYDGSRRLEVDGWSNPCGHVDKYTDVRREAVDASIIERATLSASAPATRLREYAARLNDADWRNLVWKVINGDRLIVFNVDGDRVTLASEQEMVGA